MKTEGTEFISTLPPDFPESITSRPDEKCSEIMT